MYFHLTMMLVVIAVTLAMQAMASAAPLPASCRAANASTPQVVSPAAPSERT